MKFLSILSLYLLAFTAHSQTPLIFVEAKSGKPIEGLEVVIKSKKKTLGRGFTDAHGKFEFMKSMDIFTVEILNKADLYESGPFNVALYDKFNPLNEVHVRWNSTIELDLLKEMETRDYEQIQNSREDCNNVEYDFSEYDEPSTIDASFPGGAVSMQFYITNMVRYPQTSIEMNEQGTVNAFFVVEHDGSVTSIGICRSVSPDLDREAKLLILYMPEWEPGSEEGELVRKRCRLPINFTLN